MPNNLNNFFHPKSIAVIGASAHEGKVGNDIVRNLIKSFSGKIYPVNLKEKTVEGLQAYSSILNIASAVDLAVIVIPAQFVPQAVEECGEKKCQNIIIISVGFKEIGRAGEELEKQIAELVKKYGIRVLGPNCLGYISTNPKIDASFGRSFPKAGNIAFASQSGALGTAVLDMAQAQHLGFSYFVSMGNKLDINELDLLEYFYADKKTKVILMYLENIADGQRFMEIAKKVSQKKPIIILKAGKTEKGSRAVSSHTGSLAGAAEAYSAAFKQSGIIEAEYLENFFDFAEGFSLQKMPSGNKVAVVTNAGGPGVLVTDVLPQYGLELADLSPSIIKKLKANLPEAASVINPVDVLGDAKADRYGFALELLIKEKNIDAAIVVLTPQKMTEIKETAQTIGQISKKTKKPIILCFMGEAEIDKNYAVFKEYSLPQYNFPLQAVKVLGQMLECRKRQESGVEEAKGNQLAKDKKSRETAGKILEKSILTEVDSREIFSLFDFPLHRAALAEIKEEALVVAEKIGYPVALKVVSPDIVHKSEAGGVKLGVKNREELSQAIDEMKRGLSRSKPAPKIDGYLVGEMVKGLEVIIGMKRDPQFGPLIMLGLGGIYTEVFKDVTFRIAPFGLAEAKKMIKELKIYPLFSGARGQKPLDVNALARILVKLGDFSLLFESVKEIDFNPVMVKEDGAVIVDVRIIK
ncbi:MAG: acetate--CoA ligase alpha subunit [Patescibacteria group bacterium]